MKLSRAKGLVQANRLTGTRWNVFGLAFGLALGGFSIAIAHSADIEWKDKPISTPIPRYYDKRLRSIEDQLIKLEWEYLQTKPDLEHRPTPKMSKYLKTLPPQDLSKIAIWSRLALRDNPRWHESLGESVFYGSIWELGQRKGPEAEKAIADIAYQTTIDAAPAEALTEAWEKCTHRKFRFGGVYPRFLDESLISPMTEEAANFVMPTRIALVNKRPNNKLFEFGCSTNVDFEILPGGRVLNINCKVDKRTYNNQKVTEQDVKRLVAEVETCLKSLQIPSRLPCKLKKVRMSVQFY